MMVTPRRGPFTAMSKYAIEMVQTMKLVSLMIVRTILMYLTMYGTFD